MLTPLLRFLIGESTINPEQLAAILLIGSPVSANIRLRPTDAFWRIDMEVVSRDMRPALRNLHAGLKIHERSYDSIAGYLARFGINGDERVRFLLGSGVREGWIVGRMVR